MLTLTGKVLEIIAPVLNRQTGELNPPTIELLHKVRGRSTIENLKIDEAVFPHWEKAVGKEVIAEVNYYALVTKEGAIIKGLVMADRASLPFYAPTGTTSKATPT